MASIRMIQWPPTSLLSAKKPKPLLSRAARREGSIADAVMSWQARLRAKQNGEPGGKRRGPRNDRGKGSALVPDDLTNLDAHIPGRQAAHPTTTATRETHAGAEVQALASRAIARAPTTMAGAEAATSMPRRPAERPHPSSFSRQLELAQAIQEAQPVLCLHLLEQ